MCLFTTEKHYLWYRLSKEIKELPQYENITYLPFIIKVYTIVRYEVQNVNQLIASM